MDAIDRLATVTDAALACRDLNHDWPRVSKTNGFIVVTRRGNRITEVGRTLTCTHCGTTRTQVFAYPSFAPVDWKYDYAEGYQVAKLKKGERKVPAPRKADARLALFLRSGVS